MLFRMHVLASKKLGSGNDILTCEGVAAWGQKVKKQRLTQKWSMLMKNLHGKQQRPFTKLSV